METQNQPVACQCSGVLKGITVACAVLAVVLPWFGMMAALIGILLAVVSIVCAIIAVCKKATMFGIIMIVVGMIAGATTDPPTLAYASTLTEKNVSAVAYSTVYPLAMFLRILSGQFVLLILWQYVS